MWNMKPRFATLGEEFFELVKPTPLQQDVHLVHLNRELVDNFDLSDISQLDWLKIGSGAMNIVNYSSLASYYMGHQFGVPVAKLGDGRAILLGEHQVKEQIIELQLKGAGETPFSRMGDGRAVLRSSIREYLVSHAMDKLGVPTTQALSLVSSSDIVIREEIETAAMVLRVAPSFIRFGHFEYFALHGKLNDLEQLIKFVVTNYYPVANYITNKELALHLLDKVVVNTAYTIAKWQSLGFVHGVMNTDNMSILGLTIDYGPYAFMDEFAPNAIYNHSDSEGRYTYANQPKIAWWNLYRLAEAFLALDYIKQTDLQPILDSYASCYNQEYQRLMWAKLGITNFELISNTNLIEEILIFLQYNRIDFTVFWHKLSVGEVGVNDLKNIYPNVDFSKLVQTIKNEQSLQRISSTEIEAIMQKVNPAFILRNHLLHTAINKAQKGDFSEVHKLFNLATDPYQKIAESYYYDIAPNWAMNINLSCSS